MIAMTSGATMANSIAVVPPSSWIIRLARRPRPASQGLLDVARDTFDLRLLSLHQFGRRPVGRRLRGGVAGSRHAGFEAAGRGHGVEEVLLRQRARAWTAFHRRCDRRPGCD